MLSRLTRKAYHSSWGFIYLTWDTPSEHKLGTLNKSIRCWKVSLGTPRAILCSAQQASLSQVWGSQKGNLCLQQYSKNSMSRACLSFLFFYYYYLLFKVFIFSLQFDLLFMIWYLKQFSYKICQRFLWNIMLRDKMWEWFLSIFKTSFDVFVKISLLIK